MRQNEPNFITDNLADIVPLPKSKQFPSLVMVEKVPGKKIELQRFRRDRLPVSE
jgi:hypothetical protein